MEHSKKCLTGSKECTCAIDTVEKEPDRTVEVPFHGDDMEGTEELRLKLLTCKQCGSFEHFIAINECTDEESVDYGNLKAFICCKCRSGGVPETVSIKTIDLLLDLLTIKAKKLYTKAHNQMKLYRFGFFMAATFIIYLTFVK